jgi:acetyl esterase/lipase
VRRRWGAGILFALLLALQLHAQTTKPEKKPKLPPAPAGVVIQQNVDYLEPGRAEKLDLYLPANRAKGVRSPAVVIIHGGGWVGGDKAASREFEIGTTLAKAGYVCASINYTLERGNWPQNLFDCKNAVRFLRKNSDAYQVDVKHIGVTGGSAGGHLALMVAYTTDVPQLEPKAPYPDLSDAVNCVIDMYGITNLLTRSKTDDKGNAIGTPGDKAAAMLKEPREGHEDLWKSASPVTYVSEKTVPTLILHGTADTTVNRDQATELAAKLKEFGVEHQIMMIEGIGHTFDLQTWNHKPLPHDLRPVVLDFFDKHLKPSAATKAAASIQWDKNSLRYLAPGGYPRMIRLKDGATLLSTEERGHAIVRRSEDDGKTWSQPAEAAQGDHGGATNPQPIQLQSGVVLLFYNDRPNDHKNPYAICLATSRDGGRTWSQRPDAIYSADSDWHNGCWEPAAVQLASGEIVLFFANESPYRESDEQEISVMRSTDDGATWSEARAFSFRKGGRDGMPVPLILKSGELVVAIEDTGWRATRVLQPTILHANPNDSSVITEADRRRTVAVDSLDEHTYAGAPYIAQLSSGETILSCQMGRWMGRAGPRPTLFVGDATASRFITAAGPFDKEQGEWNSLYVREDDTIVALMGTEIDRKFGVWAIDGRLASGDAAR